MKLLGDDNFKVTKFVEVDNFWIKVTGGDKFPG